ncbi:uncharacterized protein LOC142824154 [Pelodiscus sinensis]|uniref:uncharacterized protein LOC142824154 n=1 Tax=Pelodiscus sinensis TaxID=13735 RepID=UPI003F6C2320
MSTPASQPGGSALIPQLRAPAGGLWRGHPPWNLRPPPPSGTAGGSPRPAARGRDIRDRPGCESRHTGRRVQGQTDRQTSALTHPDSRLLPMMPLQWVSLLVVTLAALCASQPIGEPPARWHPPPVVSVLQRLWGAQREAAPAPWEARPAAGAWPPQHAQLGTAGEVLSLPRSAPRRLPRQLALQASGRGCQLGTCQTHNLFSWLYHIGARDLKDGSQKDMADPMGYGRRRRGT